MNGAMGCTGHDAESTGRLGCRALPREDGICFAMPGPSVKVNRLLGDMEPTRRWSPV